MSLRERTPTNGMKLGTKSNRSLLGIPDREDEKLLQQQNEELISRDNDKKIG